METPPAPPKGWDQVVWLLLEARDLQKGHEKLYAKNLQVRPLVQKAWEGKDETFVQTLHTHMNNQLAELRDPSKHRQQPSLFCKSPEKATGDGTKRDSLLFESEGEGERERTNKYGRNEKKQK